jgi:Holliday junction resolvase RusA-like endonuclease
MRIEFVIEGPPVPKARARKTRAGHWYTPQKTRIYEALVKKTAAEARAKMWLETGELWPVGKKNRYRIECEFYMPSNRGYDGDNILKSIQDGAERALWTNDHQVVEFACIRRVDRTRPRAVVRAYVLATE